MAGTDTGLAKVPIPHRQMENRMIHSVLGRVTEKNLTSVVENNYH